MSKQTFVKMKRKAQPHRKKRKFRGKWKKSQKGKKAAIILKGGTKKVIKKKFFFSTYDAKGKFMGIFWFTKNKKPNDETLDHYKNTYGVKHPAILPVVDPEKKWPKKPENQGPKKPAKPKGPKKPSKPKGPPKPP